MRVNAQTRKLACLGEEGGVGVGRRNEKDERSEKQVREMRDEKAGMRVSQCARVKG